MQDLTLEYIAGFVDGEGCLTLTVGNRGLYRPRFVIANTNLKVLEDIRQYFSLTAKIQIKHRRKPNHKTIYHLESQNIEQCRLIATLLEPYLRIKKEQAQIIMQYPRSHPPYSGSRLKEDFSTRAYILKLLRRMLTLNKRGPSTQEANEDLQPEPDPQLSLLDLNQKEVIKP